MIYRVTSSLLLLLSLLPALGCDKATPVAPNGTVLTISANPSTVGLNGSSTITVVGRKPDGNPLNPGTEIRLSTDRGTIDSFVTTGDGGRATATFRADGRLGPAMITAMTGGTVMVMTTVQVGQAEGDRPMVLVSATPSTITLGGEAEITVIARNSDNTPVARGERVTLTTTLGTIRPANVTIGANGTATATLDAGNREGTATITAIVGSSLPMTTTVMVVLDTPTVLLSVAPSNIPVDGTATITVIARDTDGTPVGANQTVILTTTLGTITPDRPLTRADGTATATLNAGTQAGTATITAIVGSSAAATTTLTIRDAAADIDLQPDATSVPLSGGTITLTAFVTNTQGEPFQGAVVTFNSIGTLQNGTTGFTDSTGSVSKTITFTQEQLQGVTGNTFQVRASTPGPNGTLITDSTTVTITGR